MHIWGFLLIGMAITFGLTSSSRADDSFFFSVREDIRDCAYPMCGGYWVKRVNRNVTLCSDGQYRKECYVVDMDWNDSDFPEQQAYELERLSSTIIFRGTLTDMYFEPTDTIFHILSITEVWMSATDKEISLLIEGVFFRITDSGIRCYTTPCASFNSSRLNSFLSFPIHELDLSASLASEEQIAEAISTIFNSEDGLLVFGTNSFFREATSFGIRMSATDFYFPVKPKI